MITVRISELRNRLSHYLREVQRGKSVLVADRDRVIARIEPVGGVTAADGGDASWIADLERRGTIRRARRRLAADWLEHRPRVSSDVVAALLDERDDGR